MATYNDVTEKGERTNLELQENPPQPSPTLTVYYQNKTVFSSNGKWLYPLFELEDFLEAHPYNPALLSVYDKIVGKAAAFLIVKLGIKKMKAGILSELADEVLKQSGITYTYEDIVPKNSLQNRRDTQRSNQF